MSDPHSNLGAPLTLEPSQRGLRFLGAGVNWPGLLLIGVGDAAVIAIFVVASAVAQSDPKHFTAASPKVMRKGRIFVDYLRNQRGATAVMPYAVRVRPEAPVAAPITRKEMETIDKPSHFHIGDAAEPVKRASSKALSGWGRADQALPDL